MIRERFVKLLPLIVVVLTAIYLLFSVWQNRIVLQKPHIAGLVALNIVIIVQIINEKAGYYLTLFMLALGTLSAIAFTPTIFTFYIGLFSLDLFCLPVLLIFLVIHRRLVADIFREPKK
ncbi:hypothetical protein [Chitinophaga solisilvae]|uniref:hypothetical protein n=1 Tax=Chitinophaga solisilvae TaxID=1233460 RepID=UPI00136D563C|nr:hypothetical protein [Chitinophaga solisilvae]